MSKSKKPFSIDLTLKEGHKGYDVLHKCPAVLGMKEVQQIEKQGASSSTTLSQQEQQALVAKKQSMAMAVATGPVKQIGMNAFMMYMSGKTLNIFSISITSSAIFTPLSSLFNMSKTFAQFDGADLQMPKFIFIALNLAWFGIGLYKLASMRLLPTTSADWTGSIVWKEMMESTSIPPAHWGF